VFGPSVVIGGAMGGVVGRLFHKIMPTVATDPGAYIIVGMAGLFTAVSNTPISTIIFVSEMTNSYHLLLPSLLVCSVAYIASKRWTIYNKQVQNKIKSPAHEGDFFIDVLETAKVKDIIHLLRKAICIPQEMTFDTFRDFYAKTDQHYFPVVDSHGKLAGIFSSNDFRSVLFSQEIGTLIMMKDIATDAIITTSPSEDLNTVLHKFTAKNIDSLPVVQDEDHGILLGMLNRREVIRFYNEQVQKMKTRAGQ
jgi:CIC family chloride channel protein